LIWLAWPASVWNSIFVAPVSHKWQNLSEGMSQTSLKNMAFNPKLKVSKTGRNQPCSCGSKKKFKLCCGSIRRQNFVSEWLSEMQKNQETSVRLKQMHGKGNDFVTVKLRDGSRLFAINNRLISTTGINTYPDFLKMYLLKTMGEGWINNEYEKSLDDAHPIIDWLRRSENISKKLTANGKFYEYEPTGAVLAHLHLANDLFALDHNVELQEKLIIRLKHKDQFGGARYEVEVAAMFIRAGFTIEFEDESDTSQSHCEFTATNKRTNKKFSVEAKRKEGVSLRLGKLFNNAISKVANHTRIVCIDMNTPLDSNHNDQTETCLKAIDKLKSFEGKPLNGLPRPSAYILVTNKPWIWSLDTVPGGNLFVPLAFQMESFDEQLQDPSDTVVTEDSTHIEFMELLQAAYQYTNLPISLDGDNPEFNT
jgi:hypothetical protein